MSDRNIIQVTFDEFAKSAGFVKKSGSWYLRTPETVVVLNLQKSQYAVRYYVNVAIWLQALGHADAPKENHCHVRTRLDDLVPTEVEPRLTQLLDITTSISEQQRREELLAVLNDHLLPLLRASATLKDLQSGDGKQVVARSLVTGPAQTLLLADQ
jgi:Domain of unknown function (DUF4304)